jgi:hypothetical protein
MKTAFSRPLLKKRGLMRSLVPPPFRLDCQEGRLLTQRDSRDDLFVLARYSSMRRCASSWTGT